MQSFTIVSGRAAPLLQDNIDTDVIIRIERLTASDQSTLGDYALEAMRYDEKGREIPDFILNRPGFRNTSILIAGRNFGCGSSREGAVTALLARGIRAVIAPSFGDIFYGNCFQNGLLPVRIADAKLQDLADEAGVSESPTTVNLVDQVVVTPSGKELSFEIDPLQREAMMAGLDDVGQTQLLRDIILDWQRDDRSLRPWVWTTA